MRYATLQVITWATVSAAVVSALWLASFDTGVPDLRGALNAAGSVFRLPAEPTRAGVSAAPAAPAAPAASGAASGR